jgi:hypothetical protein
MVEGVFVFFPFSFFLYLFLLASLTSGDFLCHRGDSRRRKTSCDCLSDKVAWRIRLLYDRMGLSAWFSLLKSKLKIKIFSSLHLPDWTGSTASTKNFFMGFQQ